MFEIKVWSALDNSYVNGTFGLEKNNSVKFKSENDSDFEQAENLKFIPLIVSHTTS